MNKQINPKFNLWTDVLVFMYRNLNEEDEIFTKTIRRGLDVESAHFVKVLYALIKLGLAKKERRGRRVCYKLTDKGKEIAQYLDKIYKLLYVDKYSKQVEV